MPYRTEEPVVTYALRTSRSIYVVLAVMAFMTVALLFVGLRALSHHAVGTLFYGLALGIATLAYVRSLKNHLVAGGTGELRLFRGHLEVPPPWGGGTVSMPYDRVSVEVRRFETRVYWSTVSWVDVLILRADGVERQISSRMLEHADMVREAAEDIIALKQGLPPPSRQPPSPPPRTDDEWDARLEEELAALD